MYHKLEIIGRLGKDPEVRYQPGGQPVVSFSVASSEEWKGQDGQTHKRTHWWRVSAFGKQAETIHQYLHKGSFVYLEGRLRVDEQTGGPRLYTRPDNTVSASFEVTANVVKFLSSSRPEHHAEPTPEDVFEGA